MLALHPSLPLHVHADLKPQEIAILVKRGSRGSERLADYYAKQRGIPTENICEVVMPTGETITHEKWRWAVRPEIRKWLQDNDPQHNLRCLVTTWDVPLRIGRDKKDNPILSRYQEFLQGERTKRIKLLRDLVAEFSVLAPGVADEGSPTKDATVTSKDSKQPSEIKQLQSQLEDELQKAQIRIRKLADPQMQKQTIAKLQQYATVIGGIQILLESLQKQMPKERRGFAKNPRRIRAATRHVNRLRRHAEEPQSLGTEYRTRHHAAEYHFANTRNDCQRQLDRRTTENG